MPRCHLVVALALVAAACHGRTASRASPAPATALGRPQNLRVLPPDLPPDSLMALMRGIAGGLGVPCLYCHVTNARLSPDSSDFASDAKAPKAVARRMMRMMATLNDDLLAEIRPRGRRGPGVTCATCHRGLPRPIMIEDTLRRVLDLQGVDSTIAEYRRLRERHYGRGRFDFGLGALNTLAEHLLAAGRFGDAQSMAALNRELFPDRWETAYTMGRVHEGLADTASAVALYRAVLEAVPNHGVAQQRLDRLLRRPPF